MIDLVECHSDDQYATRPKALWRRGERLPVAKILNRWRSPEGRGFRVRTEDERIFVLLYNEAADEWTISGR